MNKKIRALRDGIIALINDANIPIEIVRLVLTEILVEVEKQSQKAIQEEDEQEKKGDEL